MKTYQIIDDVEYPERWFLKGPILPDGQEFNPATFMRGTPLTLPVPVRIPLRRGGKCLDFTLADRGMPVVNERIADFLIQTCPNDVQMFPASVEGRSEHYFILNVLILKDCMDMARSTYDVWKPSDNMPEKVGQIFGVFNLRTDSNRLEGIDICRITNWKVPIIISEKIKKFLEDNHVSGVLFEET